MKRLLLLILILLSTSAQRSVPGRYPCSVVSGCVAAFSVQRRVVAAYTGALFQLTRSSDATTQDVGQLGGRANLTTVATFCSGVTCYFHKIYNQTSQGSANDLIAVNCDTDYSVNSHGYPVVVGLNPLLCHFQADTPSGTPNGDAAISIIAVANDANTETYTSASDYSFDGGMMHKVAEPNGDKVSYDLMFRAGAAALSGNCRTFGIDLEDTIAELCYGVTEGGAPAGYLTPRLAQVSAAGDVVGATSYSTSTDIAIIDFNNGERTYSVNIGAIDIGGAQDPQIRILAAGDGTFAGNGVFYEMLIYSSTLTLTQLQTVEGNAQAFYQIPHQFACGNAPRYGLDDLGIVVTDGFVGGLRVINPHYRGPIAGLYRASDGHYLAVGHVGCDIDKAAAAAFCVATTCRVYQLFNQITTVASHFGAWGTGTGTDASILGDSGSFGPAGPIYTQNCIGTQPCMTFAGSQQITTGTGGLSFTRPFTIVAVQKNTASASFGQVFGITDASNAIYLGGGGSANTLLFQASGSGGLTTTLSDSAWASVTATTPTNTSVKSCINGTCTTSGAVTTTDQSGVVTRVGANSFSGAIAELWLINGTALSSGQAAAISAAHQIVWGY